MELNKIYNEDCLITMQKMPNNYIDMIITSPPYDNMRNYNNNYKWDFETFKLIANSTYKVLKPGGVMVWIIDDRSIKGSETCTSSRQKLYFLDNVGYKIHDTMIYYKHNGIPINPNTNKKYHQEFEYMFILSKGTLKTFNPFRYVKKCDINYTPKIRISKYKDRLRKEIDSRSIERYKQANNDYFRLDGNVWYYATGTHSSKDKIAFEHPAIFPEDLAMDHIASWSNPGDIIYDPFMGSGTVAKICLQTGRKYMV